MRLVHTADLHLGFRQFYRTDSAGRNLRELDVAKSFRALVDQVIEIGPGLMVIGGDIMHMVRPPNPVVIEAFAEFRRLTEALPRMVIIAVAGNHDAPKSADTGCILQLFAQLGIHVVDREAQRLSFPEIELSVLAVPDVPGLVRPALTPDPTARFNVLVMHGEVQGMPGLRFERAAQSYLQDDMAIADWDYIALGHYHVYQELAPNMFYSGAIDYTSSNPWLERSEEKARGLTGKGFVERDLVTGRHTFHPLPVTRDHIDLALDATGMDSAELSGALRELLDDAWPDDAIARVTVTGCSIDVQRGVEPKLLREFKARALNLTVVYKRPAALQYTAGVAIPTNRQVQSLDDMLAAVLKRRQDSGEMGPDLSLEAITKLSQGYMQRAADIEQERKGAASETVAA